MRFLFPLLLSLLLAASAPAARTCAAVSGTSVSPSSLLDGSAPELMPEIENSSESSAESAVEPDFPGASADVPTQSAIDADLQYLFSEFLSEYQANEARKQTDSELLRFSLIVLFALWAGKKITGRIR